MAQHGGKSAEQRYIDRKAQRSSDDRRDETLANIHEHDGHARLPTENTMDVRCANVSAPNLGDIDPASFGDENTKWNRAEQVRAKEQERDFGAHALSRSIPSR